MLRKDHTLPVLVLVRCSHQPLGQDPCRDVILYRVILLALQNDGDIMKYINPYIWNRNRSQNSWNRNRNRSHVTILIWSRNQNARVESESESEPGPSGAAHLCSKKAMLCAGLTFLP